MLFDEAFEVIPAVMIGNFFASFDVFLGYNIDATASVPGFSVWSTGVIGVAGGIQADAAVNIPFCIHVEHVAIVALIADLGRNALTDILDDSRAFLDGKNRKKAEAGAPALDSDFRIFGLFGGSHRNVRDN